MFNNIEINLESVKTNISKIKSGKACGYDLIQGEFIKYGGDSMNKSLLKMFTHCYNNETYPSTWLKGEIKPIHKGGSLNDLNNYRGITVTSVVYKLYASLLETQMFLRLIMFWEIFRVHFIKIGEQRITYLL